MAFYLSCIRFAKADNADTRFCFNKYQSMQPVTDKAECSDAGFAIGAAIINGK
jgi:hypothetical protein